MKFSTFGKTIMAIKFWGYVRVDWKRVSQSFSKWIQKSRVVNLPTVVKNTNKTPAIDTPFYIDSSWSDISPHRTGSWTWLSWLLSLFFFICQIVFLTFAIVFWPDHFKVRYRLRERSAINWPLFCVCRSQYHWFNNPAPNSASPWPNQLNRQL